MLAWAQKESSKTRQKEAACQSEEKAVADHKTSDSHSVQGNRGLRQNALPRHRARRSWRSQVERLKDPLVHRAVPVVVLSASPIHRVQGRFVRRDGLRGLGSILLARVLTLPRVNEACREEIRLGTLHYVHNDHRDANAAFTLAQRVMPIGGVATGLSAPASGLIGDPLSGNRTSDLGTASLMPPVQANGITGLTL